uniref:cytokine receptor common subunit beta isoform X2 n=1 Tax=Scatophagus argus TaxID=75038 RepID=UPI001ED83067|nr:cytokine receptor common subunit beta isoform X2 [Scatophagus argus]
MMPLFWVMLCSALPPLACLSGPDHCAIQESSSLQSESSLLKSLECYNDYNSTVHCRWSDHRNRTLQLWFKTNKKREQCLHYDAAVQDASQHRTVQCTYKTKAFSIGIQHTAFFVKKETETLCSSVSHKPLDLSLHLRARPPVNLSTRNAGDGGRWLDWSSPYPSSSSLNKDITYQLSYKTAKQDNWMTKDVTNTSMKLEKQFLLPGCRYEARVRARASVGQWSHWSPVVTWQTEEDAGQLPSLHCVLDGEKEVVCSWEVSKELAHFITLQLACRHNRTAQSQRCCANPTVTYGHNRKVLKYSCTLTVTDPAHLLVELQPTHNAKIFKASQHIRPDPPQKVKVREKGSNWIVEWAKSSTKSEVRLSYQLCYFRIQDQECLIQNISEGAMSMTILQSSLVPSQNYQVKVRSLVVPEEHSSYGGIPSEWSEPVNWTSHEATWSLTTLMYLFVSVLVAAVFFTLYCTIPACQRRVILWVDSVPSPGKSKILSEIKSATSWTLMQSESTSMCKVQHLDSVSTCSSDASLWVTRDSEQKSLDQDEGCWKYDNQPSLTEEMNRCDTSSLSFSGPYILCQTAEPKCRSTDIKCEEKEKQIPSEDSATPSPVNFTIYGEGYVCLPNRSVSRSTQDLVSQGDANTNMQRHDSTGQDPHHPDSTLLPDKMDVQPGLSKPTHQPPAYTSELVTPWPQGVAIQASGYCHLPTVKMRGEN